MEGKYTNIEILEAVNFLLKKDTKKNNNKPLAKKKDIPVETENLISQAEKFLGK